MSRHNPVRRIFQVLDSDTATMQQGFIALLLLWALVVSGIISIGLLITWQPVIVITIAAATFAVLYRWVTR